MKVLAFVLVSSCLLACAPSRTSSDSSAQSFTTPAIPNVRTLAGKTYSRLIAADGQIGAPAGTTFKHSLQFVDATTVIDNGDSAFGNPPQTLGYQIQGLVVMIDSNDTYTASADWKSITSEAGAVLTLEGDESPSTMTTAELSSNEMQTLIEIFNRVQVPLNQEDSGGTCTNQVATIQSHVRSFNPAKWTVAFGTTTKDLTDSEVQPVIAMFNRLKVAAVARNSIDLVSSAEIKSRVCGFNPARWTATYQKSAN